MYFLQNVPDELLKNVTDVIPQVMPVPKHLDEYTQEEKDNYPRLFDW